MRIGSLFSGIGGLELGLEWAGVGRTVWQVERDPFCRAVLARHWPDAERFEDVCTVGASNLAPVDVICGGFPCQDISYAGKGAGLDGERSGLWFEFARIVREMGPRFVVVENVSALLTRGLDAVLGTLASLGYDAEWCCVRASDVGARHRRDRVFLVGHMPLAHDDERCACQRRGGLLDGEWAARRHDADRCGQRDVGDAGGKRRDQGGADAWQGGAGRALAGGADVVGHAGRSRREGTDWCGPDVSAQVSAGAGPSWMPGASVAQPSMGRAAHGVSARMDVAGPGQPQHGWEAPRIASTAPHRSKRLRALGNAVVPQVAQVVGRRLMELDTAAGAR